MASYSCEAASRGNPRFHSTSARARRARGATRSGCGHLSKPPIAWPVGAQGLGAPWLPKEASRHRGNWSGSWARCSRDPKPPGGGPPPRRDVSPIGLTTPRQCRGSQQAGPWLGVDRCSACSICVGQIRSIETPSSKLFTSACRYGPGGDGCDPEHVRPLRHRPRERGAGGRGREPRPPPFRHAKAHAHLCKVGTPWDARGLDDEAAEELPEKQALAAADEASALAEQFVDTALRESAAAVLEAARSAFRAPPARSGARRRRLVAIDAGDRAPLEDMGFRFKSEDQALRRAGVPLGGQCVQRAGLPPTAGARDPRGSALDKLRGRVAHDTHFKLQLPAPHATIAPNCLTLSALVCDCSCKAPFVANRLLLPRCLGLRWTRCPLAFSVSSGVFRPS